VLRGEETVEALAARHSRLPASRRVAVSNMATEVQTDNETSDRFTIVDVFAEDRQGLLYVITRAMFRLGLSVHGARISTRLDQVADIFYVTDREGRKLADSQLEGVRAAVLRDVDTFLHGMGLSAATDTLGTAPSGVGLIAGS
jgi:[protein-PII] uridylyltransferase